MIKPSQIHTGGAVLKRGWTFAKMWPLFLGITLFLTTVTVLAQQEKKRLTYKQAYGGMDMRYMMMMSRIRWLDDTHYLLSELDKKTKKTILVKVDAKTGEKKLFLDYGLLEKHFPDGIKAVGHIDNTKDYTSLLYFRKDDLYHFSSKTNTYKRLTATPARENNAQLSPDGRFVAYTRDHNLYTLDIEKGLEYQLTEDGSDTIYNGWASWVYMEEILGRGTRYRAFWWSPDSQKLAYLRFDDSPVPTFPLFRKGGTHGELEIERYPKSGDPNPYVKLGIVPATGGKTVWADVEEKADHYVAWPFWLPDSSGLTFQWMNRGQDHIKIYSVDLESGQKLQIYEEKQPAWVEFFEDLYFFKNGSGFLLRTHADGWSHLYVYDLEGRLKKRLTEGEWTVTSIARVDEKNGRVFFNARKDKSTETHLYAIKLDGTGFKKLTKEAGLHRASVSLGGNYFIDSFSSITTPTKQNLHKADGTLVRMLKDMGMPDRDAYSFGKKELFTIPTEDGWELPAYWVLPPDFDESQKYPVIFTIYGGPNAGRVYNSYPSTSELYLAQEGIIIFSVDHRGSGHFGKKGVDLMHRNLGKWEMSDLIEAVKWLHQKPFVDKTKIGITGGSYGGYTTCMALTYGADYFTHGYARSSVTDWHLYDSVYTERYMDRPCENEEGYKVSSAMTHAKNLKGILFMSHGDMDDNVHMQNTIQLIDKLMDCGKQFEFMLYPDQRHGFRAKKREHSNRHYVDFWFKHFLNR
jgi:dipeptidyl-peptidase-4